MSFPSSASSSSSGGGSSSGDVSARGRLLDVAEELFAERGFDAVSLRAITSAAGANVAAVNYYFGSRDGLVAEVIGRRLGPMNRARLRLLAEAESLAAERGEAATVEAVLEAFFRPVADIYAASAHRRDVFFRLMGRCMAESGERMNEMMVDQFRDVVIGFVGALERALPGKTQSELQIGLLFTAGVMVHSLTHIDKMAALTGDRGSVPAMSELMEKMVAFAAAGLRSGAAGRNARNRTGR